MYLGTTDDDHSPNSEATDGEAGAPGPRLRRRGPRSIAARARRLDRNQAWNSRQATGHDDGMCPLKCDLWKPAKFSILHLNIRGFLKKCAELTARLRSMKVKPTMVCLNETFLNKSVQEVTLEGNTLVGRRDRQDGRKCGGGAAFAKKEVSGSITLLEASATSERLWGG